jgi:energy-converting hydrogenase Eha subunit E
MSDLEMATLFTSLDFDLSGTIEMEEFVKFMNAPIHSLKKKKKIMVTARVAPTPIVPLGEYESEEDAEIMVPPHHPNEGSNSSNSSNSLDTSNNSKPSTRLEHTGTILDIMEEEEPETEEMSSPRNNTIQSKEISSIQENSEEAQDVSSNLTFTKKAVKPSGNQKKNGDQNASTGYVTQRLITLCVVEHGGVVVHLLQLTYSPLLTLLTLIGLITLTTLIGLIGLLTLMRRMTISLCSSRAIVCLFNPMTPCLTLTTRTTLGTCLDWMWQANGIIFILRLQNA